ncbi:MAG: heme utilization protein, partial [Rhodoferax sp.]|nr:heme utilization protein [Rhodoferax sp.]
AGLSTTNLGALTTAQVQAVETVDLAALTTAQVQSMNTSAVAAITTSQVQALLTSQLAALSTTTTAALTTAQIVSLTTAQVAGLTTANVAALTTAQVVAIETADIAALTTSEMGALTTAQAFALTTTQLSALSTTQIESFATASFQALTTTQTAVLTLSTPLILDLNGDGVKTLAYSSGVNFDLFARGQTSQTGWVSSSDGLLVLDRNHDGQINDGSELFGSSVTLSDGTKAADGYVALRELDTNHDGVMSQDDAGFNDLRVWVDGNSDGVSATGEIKSLASLQITKIDLQTTASSTTDNGNLVGLTSSYQTADGLNHVAADVWFVADKPIAAVSPIAPVTGVPAVPDVPAVVVPPVPPVDTAENLRTRVSSLAQSISAFDAGQASNEASIVAPISASGSGPGTGPGAGTMVAANMAGVMNQFDANGNPLSNLAGVALPAVKPLIPTGPQDPASGGFLTTGGQG